MDDQDDKGLVPIGDILPKLIKPHHKPLSRIKERLVSMPLDQKQVATLYQHSVLCQTCMPYRDPGDAIRIWQRRNGLVRLELQAGRVLDPNMDDFVNIGLPFGPKSAPRRARPGGLCAMGFPKGAIRSRLQAHARFPACLPDHPEAGAGCLPGSSIHHGWKGDAPVPQLSAHPAQVRIPRLADDTEVVQNPRVEPLIHGHFVALTTATLSRKPIVKSPIGFPIVVPSHL